MRLRLLLMLIPVLLIVFSCEGGDPTGVVFSGSGSGCGKDSFENNDSAETAKKIFGDFSGAEGFTYEKLSSCPGDIDWFKVTLVAGECLTVELLFVHADGNINLAIYNTELIQIKSSVTTTNNELAAAPAASSSGSHYIMVFSPPGEPQNAYTMNVKVSSFCL